MKKIYKNFFKSLEWGKIIIKCWYWGKINGRIESRVFLDFLYDRSFLYVLLNGWLEWLY